MANHNLYNHLGKANKEINPLIFRLDIGFMIVYIIKKCNLQIAYRTV